MTELTLEALAKRIEALEKKLAERAPVPPTPDRDWLKVVGMFDDDPDFMRAVIAEGEAIREAERKAAREGETE